PHSYFTQRKPTSASPVLARTARRALTLRSVSLLWNDPPLTMRDCGSSARVAVHSQTLPAMCRVCSALPENGRRYTLSGVPGLLPTHSAPRPAPKFTVRQSGVCSVG